MDPNSDIVTARMDGLCSDCMILEAGSVTTFQDGKRMGLSDGLYTHHIIFIDPVRAGVRTPLKPICGNGTGMIVKTPGGGTSTQVQGDGDATGHSHGIEDAGHSHGHKVRRKVPLHRRQLDFPISLLVAIGHDGMPHVFDAKGDEVNAGFYVGPSDPIIMMSELINYETKEKETYIRLEYEYLPGGRPEGYLDVTQGFINMEGCTPMGLSIRKRFHG